MKKNNNFNNRKIYSIFLDNKLIIFSFSLVITAILLFFVGYMMKSFNIILLSILLAWIANLSVALSNFKRGIYFLFFNITFFTFIFSGNIFKMFSGDIWHNFSSNIEIKTNIIIFSALLSLFFGYVILYFVNRFDKRECEYFPLKNTRIKGFVQKYSLIIFCISLFLSFLIVIEKVAFVFENSYLDFYTSFNSTIPTVFHNLSSFLLPSLLLYLFTFPKIKRVIGILIPFSIYVFLTLGTGSRSTFVLSILIILIYFIYSQFNKIYFVFNKRRIVWFVVFGFLGVSFLCSFNLIRNRAPIKNYNPIYYFKQFFVDQSTSINVIKNAEKYKSDLRSMNKNYTFSNFVSFYKYSSLFKIFRLGKKPYPIYQNNTLEMALYGDSLGQTISYLALGDKYLQGHGLGTEYLAELYIDFDIWGIIVYNVLLGCILYFFSNISVGNFILNTYIFLVIYRILYMPRENASNWMMEFFSIKNFILICMPYLIYQIVIKNKRSKNENTVDC